MRAFSTFEVADPALFRQQLLSWLADFDTTVYLDSNNDRHDRFHAYDVVAGAGIEGQIEKSARERPFEALYNFHQQENDWLLGFFAYELKNGMDRLSSANPDYIAFPDLFFFRPSHLFLMDGHIVSISSLTEDPAHLYSAITNLAVNNMLTQAEPPQLHPRMSKNQYLKSVRAVQQHIREGDVYELNLCQEFFSQGVSLTSPSGVFHALNTRAEAPFSAFVRKGARYLLCSSPERFMAKQGRRLVSQPIKGTAKRGATNEEDRELKQNLQASIKEQAENVMIVDLVRNDLARNAVTGSVHVDELFGIYTFKHVHQMISTITARLRDDVPFSKVIADAFPMGSMTGAPKVSAMELIEHYEQTRRGLFSGSVGYITPEGNFDVNVVIRSILYNAVLPYISVQVGGAITLDSDPEQEYEECMIKAKGMRDVLSG